MKGPMLSGIDKTMLMAIKTAVITSVRVVVDVFSIRIFLRAKKRNCRIG